MQLKNTEGPSQGSLPPRMAEAPPPRCEGATTPRVHSLLRHRCPLKCSHSHSVVTPEGPHKHPTNNEHRQGTADQHPQHDLHYYHRHHHHHHYNPYQPSSLLQSSSQSCPQQEVATSNLTSRSPLTECRVPPLYPSALSGNSSLPQPLIPRYFRSHAIQFMSERLQMGVNVEEQSVREIERRIQTLEKQVYESSTSQEEYVSRLASRLAAILQHLHKCRSPRAPEVPLRSQQEPVM